MKPVDTKLFRWECCIPCLDASESLIDCGIAGDDHVDTAACCNNVGAALESMGRTSEALKLYRRCDGSDIERRWIFVFFFANRVCVCVGLYITSQDSFRAHDILRGTVGPAHPRAALVLRNIGRAKFHKYPLPLARKPLLLLPVLCHHLCRLASGRVLFYIAQ